MKRSHSCDQTQRTLGGDGVVVLSRDQILAQAVLFFLAGVDTSANTLAMSAYHLALNQEVQARLVEEIDQALLTHVSARTAHETAVSQGFAPLRLVTIECPTTS